MQRSYTAGDYVHDLMTNACGIGKARPAIKRERAAARRRERRKTVRGASTTRS